jgi:O-antigen biosynthesis protein
VGTINLDVVNPVATIITPGNYDVNIAVATVGPRVVFSGTGTYIVTSVAGLLSGYTIEASNAANVVVNSLASIASTAALQVDANSSITLGSAINAATVITASFNGTGGTLNIAPALLSVLSTVPVISSFSAGDHLEFGVGTGTSGFTTGYNASTHILTLLQSSVPVGAVKLSGAYTNANFVVGTDGNGITEVNFVACFLRGTQITTPSGDVDVEMLSIGDPVLTADGEIRAVKWIGRRSYNPRLAQRNPEVLPVLIKAGALANGIPRRNLHVSPRHAMLIDGMLIQAIELVNGHSIVQDMDPEFIDYFHVELDQHAVILAEDAPTESYVTYENRHIFQNAAEYLELYGPEVGLGAGLCAPLITGGPLADAVRARLAARAGLASPALMSSSALLGYVDHVGTGVVEGWAMDEVRRNIPLMLDIFEDDQLVARTVADRYRPDLVALGAGAGRHGFRVSVPLTATAHRIIVRRSVDGAVLPGSHESAEKIAA